eukprot:scaffold17778_cov78-Phaeocystis_antarctica.AAC.7
MPRDAIPAPLVASGVADRLANRLVSRVGRVVRVGRGVGRVDRVGTIAARWNVARKDDELARVCKARQGLRDRAVEPPRKLLQTPVGYVPHCHLKHEQRLPCVDAADPRVLVPELRLRLAGVGRKELVAEKAELEGRRRGMVAPPRAALVPRLERARDAFDVELLNGHAVQPVVVTVVVARGHSLRHGRLVCDGAAQQREERHVKLTSKRIADEEQLVPVPARRAAKVIRRKGEQLTCMRAPGILDAAPGSVVVERRVAQAPEASVRKAPALDQRVGSRISLETVRCAHVRLVNPRSVAVFGATYTRVDRLLLQYAARGIELRHERCHGNRVTNRAPEAAEPCGELQCGMCRPSKIAKCARILLCTERGRGHNRMNFL